MPLPNSHKNLADILTLVTFNKDNCVYPAAIIKYNKNNKLFIVNDLYEEGIDFNEARDLVLESNRLLGYPFCPIE